MDFDCVLFQSRDHWPHDQHRILTPEQRALPRIYLEHDPPQEHPTDSAHPVVQDWNRALDDVVRAAEGQVALTPRVNVSRQPTAEYAQLLDHLAQASA